MVKLKEAQDADRVVPIVSFIARQRDLSQFLGEQAQGAVRNELSRKLSHHDSRFETVTLADSNLSPSNTRTYFGGDDPQTWRNSMIR